MGDALDGIALPVRPVVRRVDVPTVARPVVVAVAAFALLGSIANGLTVAMQTPAERESALLTFMITASGMTLAGVGSAFWGVVGGMLALLVLKPREPKAA